jgi:hypothetical protein
MRMAKVIASVDRGRHEACTIFFNVHATFATGMGSAQLDQRK